MSLDTEQEEALSMLVEAARSTPRDQREAFLALHYDDQRNFTVRHKGLPGGQCLVYTGDIDVLSRNGLILLKSLNRAVHEFDIMPEGFAYYREMKMRESEPVQSVETNITHYLNGDRFRLNYPEAYQKLKDAEALLWDSDSERQLTTIGHLCREALQEFANSLIVLHNPPEFDQDKARTVSRLKSVIGAYKDTLGKSNASFLDAICNFWGTVIDLIQRQEHGGQKEGEPLVWEDGRRAVFQTAVVMYEIDSCLTKRG